MTEVASIIIKKSGVKRRCVLSIRDTDFALRMPKQIRGAADYIFMYGDQIIKDGVLAIQREQLSNGKFISRIFTGKGENNERIIVTRTRNGRINLEIGLLKNWLKELYEAQA